MRVFKFASDDFWCQCCRYSPFRLSKAAMTAKKEEEPRFLADLAAIQLNLNSIPLDHNNDSYVYLELPEEDITQEERNNNRVVFVRYKLMKIKKNHEARYSREHRMIYIPCALANPVGGGENHKVQPKSTKNPSKSTTYVPLASMLHQRTTRTKLIKELFHTKSPRKLATSILGSFDLLKRDILAQMIPAEVVVAQANETRPRVQLDKSAVANSRFNHCRTPSWQKWDSHFKHLLPTVTQAQQLLDFQEHDVRSHGGYGAILKYGFKTAKHTAVFEWMKEFTADKAATQTESQKNFMLTNNAPALLACISPLEKLLAVPHYDTEDGRNEKKVGPLVAAGTVLRYEEATDLVAPQNA